MPGVPVIANSPAAWKTLIGAAPLLMMLILAFLPTLILAPVANIAAPNDGEGLRGFARDKPPMAACEPGDPR